LRFIVAGLTINIKCLQSYVARNNSVQLDTFYVSWNAGTKSNRRV